MLFGVNHLFVALAWLFVLLLHQKSSDILKHGKNPCPCIRRNAIEPNVIVPSELLRCLLLYRQIRRQKASFCISPFLTVFYKNNRRMGAGIEHAVLLFGYK